MRGVTVKVNDHATTRTKGKVELPLGFRTKLRNLRREREKGKRREGL